MKKMLKVVGVVCSMSLAIFPWVTSNIPSVFLFGELPFPKDEK